MDHFEEKKIEIVFACSEHDKEFHKQMSHDVQGTHTMSFCMSCFLEAFSTSNVKRIIEEVASGSHH